MLLAVQRRLKQVETAALEEPEQLNRQHQVGHALYRAGKLEEAEATMRPVVGRRVRPSRLERGIRHGRRTTSQRRAAMQSGRTSRLRLVYLCRRRCWVCRT